MNMNTEIKKAAINEYLDECQEMLERLSKNLSTTEKNGFNKEIIAAIYRDMHTIKGTSQLFGFNDIGRLAHVLESCLDPVRKEKISFSQELMDCVYSGIDYITILLQAIRENKGVDYSGPISKLIAKITVIIESSLTAIKPLLNDKILISEKISLKEFQSKKEVRSMVLENSTQTKNAEFEIFDEVPPANLPQEKNNNKKILEQVSVNSIENKDNETIRIQVAILDSLMNLVGELVLIRNQLLQHTKINEENHDFVKLSQRLNNLTAELQNEVMKTRLQPIGNVFNMFVRVVRDVSKELGKKIELDVQGADTELDKTILEAVKDPLMHIVRNALDHGIEQLDERRKIGKKEISVLHLKAFHESGQVIIEVADDGRGLLREKIGKKAIEKGIITAEMLSRMSDKEVQFLIFSPGFSTAESISNISGRGVGMDVVKTNIEKIGGVVDLFSKPGLGTTIKLKIPLSLAIVPALIVQSNSQHFAIPQTKLVELIRIEKMNTSQERIEYLQGKPVLRLRGKILPIVALSDILFGENNSIKNPINADADNIVVLNAEGLQFGLIVDNIENSVDIVVKALSQFLKDLKAFSGATIMGDGTVALTIDVSGIADIAGLTAEHQDNHINVEENKHRLEHSYRSENCEILLIGVGAVESYAIPLALVSRIEEFENSRFEHSGEQKVIRYRDELLPIFSLPEFLHLPCKSTVDHDVQKKPVVVIKRGQHIYGIEVKEIQDIVEVVYNVDQSVRDRPGILGTLVSKERVIVVVDILGMIDSLKSKLEINLFGKNDTDVNSIAYNGNIERKKFKILLVEDSSFFRNYIRQVLDESGYVTEVACDGREALTILESKDPKFFSLILSDIEMPFMDGYELAQKVRASDLVKNIPIFAITTKFSSQDIQRGKEAGFNKYLEKLNAEKLIADLDELFCKKA